MPETAADRKYHLEELIDRIARRMHADDLARGAGVLMEHEYCSLARSAYEELLAVDSERAAGAFFCSGYKESVNAGGAHEVV